MTLYSLSEIKVLDVEDNQFMRTLLVDALKAMSVGSIEAANSGSRALDLMADNRYDLIITDLEMENGNGIELIEGIRKGRNIEDPLVPIIVLSANTTRSMILSTRDAGTTEFLAKPVSAKALYNRISAIIEAPRDFIRTDDYFGPDRRRKRDTPYKGPERRKDKH
jgi:two-component system, chemotaxis family, chemotaxis protein CheY